MALRKLVLAALLAAAALPAAAQTQPAAPVPLATPRDLFEPVNRTMFGLNSLVVDYLVDPLAGVLGAVTPPLLQRLGSNVYENISEPEFVFTNLVAGYPGAAAVSVGRFAVNSTVGLAGLLDAATPLGLERRTTEVSEALCQAGIPPGPYLVLPLIGPTNLFSGGLLGGVLLAEWYALSLVSAALAAGDAIFDLSVSVASLRHVRDLPADQIADPYAAQQQEFWHYVRSGCTPGVSAVAAVR
jgi:phospholipid-binding lipoprotein MlaA